tara:strand:+ start:75 stop:239 length:165 start_codon:yes stop_codon:yes gene_type:complete
MKFFFLGNLANFSYAAEKGAKHPKKQPDISHLTQPSKFPTLLHQKMATYRGKPR